MESASDAASETSNMEDGVHGSNEFVTIIHHVSNIVKSQAVFSDVDELDEEDDDDEDSDYQDDEGSAVVVLAKKYKISLASDGFHNTIHELRCYIKTSEIADNILSTNMPPLILRLRSSMENLSISEVVILWSKLFFLKQSKRQSHFRLFVSTIHS
jgi:hypothetical protein